MPNRPAAKRPDNSFRDFVLEQLDGLGDVVAKRMFGGLGFYCDGTFFAVADGTRLYFKVDDESKAQYEAAGMGSFKPTETIELASYYEVPLEVVEDATELKRWAGRAVTAQKKIQATKKRSPAAKQGGQPLPSPRVRRSNRSKDHG